MRMGSPSRSTGLYKCWNSIGQEKQDRNEKEDKSTQVSLPAATVQWWLTLQLSNKRCLSNLSFNQVIFTKKLKLRVGFDLSRTAEVKVQTLLKGWCTNDVEVQSEWVHATFRVPLQG